ncbi:exonuclease SbcCD subunit D [Oceanobacillus sp. J11TS1]|uniref:metallophosphoesterase family protein n=1 Tax=Oceanobacillus sp. J11TS1 TaxID=2807191 RepID=UPI001B163941|nr:putative metallophosphoesterase YhaO [Oceanobacillus sp. J11TS1]
MDNAVTFIHAADLHLDSLFKGLRHVPANIFKEIQESTFTALNHLIDAAIENQVDFILLAGDLYDHESQSLKAQIRLRRAFERLEEQNIAVFLSHGNHDFMKGDSFDVEYPDNVHIFPGETVTCIPFYKNGEKAAAIYGFSYENRAVYENKAVEYEPVEEDFPFHIAMLHGSVATNTEHDSYAPFQIKDLLKKQMDYWALGHIHKRQQLHTNPPIIYPGNTQGRHRKETGEKGCYLIKLDRHEINQIFLPLQAIRYEEVVLDIRSCLTPSQAEKRIMSQLPRYSVPSLLYLKIRAKENDGFKPDEALMGELIELINESLAEGFPWQYIYHCQLNLEEESTLTEDAFLKSILEEADESFIQEGLKEIYHHRTARKFLTALTDEQEQAIKEDAYQLLNVLLREERAE